MRLEDVMNFLIVAESRSLTAASEKLGIGQPTLSKSIARLERALGLPVVERLARGIVLTEAGRAFVMHSRPAAANLRDGIAAVRDLRTGRGGTIRVGLGTGVPEALVAEALKPMISQNRVSVEITGGMSNSLSKAVADGDCDFAITGTPPSDSTAVTWAPMFHDPVIPVVSPSHPLAGRRSMDWATLRVQRWILPGPGTPTRRWFEDQFHERKLSVPAQIISLQNYASSPEVWANIGAVFLRPQSYIRFNRARLQVTELCRPPDWRSERHVGITTRRGALLSSAAQRLLDRVCAIGARKLA